MPRSAPTLLAISLVACQPDGPMGNPPELRDQSGAVFGWECDESCRVVRLEDSPALPECGPTLKPTYSYSWGDFVMLAAVCADSKGWVTFPEWERFVVCETDADCPYIVNAQSPTEYMCHAGFCRPTDAADHLDQLPLRWAMEQLCMGHIARFEPYEVSPELAAALDAACPDAEGHGNVPCLELPAGCPDPRG